METSIPHSYYPFSSPFEGLAFLDPRGKEFSYQDAYQMICSLGAALAEKGIIRGDRVAILSPNSIEFACAIFALQQLGASVVPLNIRLTESDWQAQLRDAACKMLLVDDSLFEKSAFAAISVLRLSILRDLAPKEHREDIFVPFAPEREAAVIFTSGSTGHTKGVCLSLKNLYASALGSNEVTGLSPEDRWLVSTPMFHLSGFSIFYRTALARACAVFCSGFDNDSIISAITNCSVTHLSCVPTMLERLFEEGGPRLFRNIKVIILAGAPSSEKLLDTIKKHKLPVLSSYGMTETSAHMTATRPSDPIERVHTVGRPFFNGQIAVLKQDGQPAMAGQTGEIAFRGEMVFDRYLNPSEHPKRMHNDWFCSGDIGTLDKDGYLSVLGRKDDMFISGGENIHAGEIERVGENAPGVAACAVVAVDHEKWGKRPIMFIEAGAKEPLELSRVEAFMRASLAKIKVPDRIIPLDSMPRTALGKIDYKKLQSICFRHPKNSIPI